MSAENSAKDLPVTGLKMLSEEIAKHNLSNGIRVRISIPSRMGMIERIVLLELPDVD